MAGIYIHVPFCATRCIYCDFYSTTSSQLSDQYVQAVIAEMQARCHELHEPVHTVYFGGGTPSQLAPAQLRQLLDALSEYFDLSQCHEVTIEANPEDIAQPDYDLELLSTPNSKLSTLNSKLSITRVSMGVQSLVDAELQLLHRRHDAVRVTQAVQRLRQAGISNISLDLMYGLPTQTLESWAYSIDQLLQLRPQHISAYNLSVEEGTRLYQLVQQGQLTPADDDTCLAMASLLRHKLSAAGYEQYEISNYALPGYHSRHNSSYWVQTPYLGLGPGAHSYDGQHLRTWNAPDLRRYLQGQRQEQHEHLTPLDLYNERVMLGLRTAKGVPLALFLPYQAQLTPVLQSLHHRQLVHTIHAHLILTQTGLALADEVIRELMILED